jgi:hypothetical protein
MLELTKVFQLTNLVSSAYTVHAACTRPTNKHPLRRMKLSSTRRKCTVFLEPDWRAAHEIFDMHMQSHRHVATESYRPVPCSRADAGFFGRLREV